MATLPDLVGRLRLDMSDLSRAQGEATQRGAAIGSALGSAIGNLAGGALAAAGQKVTEFVTGSVDAFARLQDSTQAASVVFGNSFGTVEKFASQAASSIGISKAEALDASITFGTFGKAAGLAGEPLAGFSDDMVKLAGDMASFRGTSPQEAIEAIGAAFRGETDPIEKYGVLINQATVKQEAERLGLIKHGEELTNHARIMATQSLIYKQTADAQGDFQRSGDSVANTQKRIAAETENAQAALGEKLAPAYLAVLNALNQVITGVTKFLDVVGPIVAKIWEWKDAIAAVLIVIGILNAQTIAFNVAAAAYLAVQSAIRIATTAWTAVQWLLNAALTANPIGLVIAAIAALVAGIIVAYNHSETFRNFVNQLWATISEGLASIPAKWEAFKQTVVDMFNAAVAKGQEFIAWWQNLPTAITTAIGDFAGFLWQKIVGAWESVKTGVVTTMTNLVNDVTNWITNVVNALLNFGAQLWANIGKGWEFVKTNWSAANQAIVSTIGGWISNIAGGLADFGNRALGAIGKGWEFTKTTWNQANQYLFDRAKEFVGKVQTALGDFGGMLNRVILAAWNALPAPIQQAITNIINLVKDMATRIPQQLAALPGQMVQVGKDVMNGLLQGLQSLGPQIVSYLTNLIPEPVRRALNIASPSGVFRDIGQNIMQGLQAGLDDLLPQLQAKVQQVIDLVRRGGEAAGSVSIGGQNLDYNVKASAQGVSGSASFAGQQISGGYDAASGKASLSGFGKSLTIDARSFGTQLNPKDVVDQILWKAKAGGLVPA